MRAGERGSVVHVVQLFVMTVVNFTTGMLLTMFLFACRLPSYIASFGPSLVREGLQTQNADFHPHHHETKTHALCTACNENTNAHNNGPESTCFVRTVA